MSWAIRQGDVMLSKVENRLDLGNLFWSFQDRIGRGRWWLGLALVAVTAVALHFVGAFLDTLLFGNPATAGVGYWVAGILGGLLFAFIPLVAISVKRLHDRGRSGWWLLLFLAIPLAAIASSIAPALIWIILACVTFVIIAGFLIDLGVLAGDPAANEYGPAPV